MRAALLLVLTTAPATGWLDPGRGGLELLRPCPEDWLEAVPVSTRVNSPRNDDATIIQPEREPASAQRLLV